MEAITPQPQETRTKQFGLIVFRRVKFWVVRQYQIHLFLADFGKKETEQQKNMLKYLDILSNISGNSLAFALRSAHISRSFLLKA